MLGWLEDSTIRSDSPDIGVAESISGCADTSIEALTVVPGDRHARYCHTLSSLLTWLPEAKPDLLRHEDKMSAEAENCDLCLIPHCGCRTRSFRQSVTWMLSSNSGPEELGGTVIQYLNAQPTNDQQQLNRHNFLNY